jgi:hypothetical protein
LDTLDPRDGTPAPSPQRVQPVNPAGRARHLACNLSREAGSFRDPNRTFEHPDLEWARTADVPAGPTPRPYGGCEAAPLRFGRLYDALWEGSSAG